MKKSLFLLLFLSACSNNMLPEVSKTLEDEVAPESPKPAPVNTSKKRIRSIELPNSEVIKLSGEIGEALIDSSISKLNRMNKDADVTSIYILIDSPGGSVLDGAKFISAMEASRKPIYTVCTSICASMAAIIHQYGTKRYMFDRSVLMFHDAAAGLQGPLPQMRSRLEFFERMTFKMDSFIARRAGVDLTAFINSLHSEIWIDSEDSTAKHFNDEIIYILLKDEEVNLLTELSLVPKESRKMLNLEN